MTRFAVVLVVALCLDARVTAAEVRAVAPARTETRVEAGQQVRMLSGEMTLVGPKSGWESGSYITNLSAPPSAFRERGIVPFVRIDARDFASGTVEIDYGVGSGPITGTFAFYRENSADSWVREVAGSWNTVGSSHRFKYSFTKGAVFLFVAASNYAEKKVGATTTVSYRIRIRGTATDAPSALRFVRQTDRGFEAIQTIRHGERFFLEAQFDAEPPHAERTVSVEWDTGQQRDVVVIKTTDPKVFRSRVMTVEPPAAAGSRP
jgi:hypothetical protein